ncbi:MAG: CBS domain-containing protein [Candidatus Aenigmatarchaeota archaeon]
MSDDLRVKDAMARNVITIDSNESVYTAAEIMSDNRVGCLIVKKLGKPVGIVTESDIVKKITSKDARPRDVKISAIMSWPLVFASPDEKLTNIAKRMTTYRIRRLPVLQAGNIVGIITHTDIVKVSPELHDLLADRLAMREYGSLSRKETRVPEDKRAGMCKDCGKFSSSLVEIGDDWLCGECLREEERTGEAQKKRRAGFKEWSRMD